MPALSGGTGSGRHDAGGLRADRGWSCVGAPGLSNDGGFGSWAEVKSLLLAVAASTKEGLLEFGRRANVILDVLANPEVEAACRLGHYALRLGLILLLDAPARAQNLCGEPAPLALGASLLEVLTSGWPIFGLLGLLAYRLVRDGSARGLGAPDCNEAVESFRIRYAAAAFENGEVRFSRDVEGHILERLAAGPDKRTALPDADEEAHAYANASQRCVLGEALPLLGHVASLQCLARRDAPLRALVVRLLGEVEAAFLPPAASSGAARTPSPRRSPLTAAAARACGGGRAAAKQGSALSLLAAGLWASEAFMLLQRAAPIFAAHGPRPPLGGPEPAPTSDVVVSFDPQEKCFFGRGLPELATHLWGAADGVPGFRVRQGLPCADVLVVRDSLPPDPFPGALLYVDHEAGLGPGRDAGRLDGVLSRHPVVYLGVLEPLAKTRCLSRGGASAAARARRSCAKVFSGSVEWRPPRRRLENYEAAEELSPPSLIVIHVPFASTSFAGRGRHSPEDLATGPRPFEAKSRLLGYLAYTCVDHRERLFDLLGDAAARQGLGAVEALSRCAGYRSGHRRVRNHTRGNRGEYLDEAVELLRPYRFALVFENKLVPGYVTEKLANAFLAGSIPVYWGSLAAREVFNPEAFLHANVIQGAADDAAAADPLRGLELVAAEVARVAGDAGELRRLATAPVLSAAQLRRYFSWHGGVRRRLRAAGDPGPFLPERLSAALGRALGPRRRLVLCAGGRLCPAGY